VAKGFSFLIINGTLRLWQAEPNNQEVVSKSAVSMLSLVMLLRLVRPGEYEAQKPYTQKNQQVSPTRFKLPLAVYFA